MADAFRTAYELGNVAKNKEGGMVQTVMSESEVQTVSCSRTHAHTHMQARTHAHSRT